MLRPRSDHGPLAARNGDGPTTPDIPRVLARARGARLRAESLRDLAHEAEIQAIIAQVRAERVPLSAVVEARLHLLLGKESVADTRRPESR